MTKDQINAEATRLIGEFESLIEAHDDRGLLEADSDAPLAERAAMWGEVGSLLRQMLPQIDRIRSVLDQTPA